MQKPIVLRRASGRLISSDQVDRAELASRYSSTYSQTSLIIPPKDILYDYAKFFRYGGGVLHPRIRDAKGFPVRVLDPAPWQIKFAKMDRGVMLASNKIGKTMGESIEDFRSRLIPEYAGFDCLLVGQNQYMADQHLLDLKKWVLASEHLNQFFITRPEKRFKRLPEEKSKMTMMYIENPYNPKRPSRIIAIGFSEALAHSWKNVNRIHISDPGQISRLHQITFFGGLYSRLSNTQGQIKIEGVAGERTGYFWDLCRSLFGLEDKYESEQDILDPDRLAEIELSSDGISKSFQKIMITVDEAIQHGVITQEWLDFMKSILPKDEIDRLYYCVFKKPGGAIFGDFISGEHIALGLAQAEMEMESGGDIPKW